MRETWAASAGPKARRPAPVQGRPAGMMRYRSDRGESRLAVNAEADTPVIHSYLLEVRLVVARRHQHLRVAGFVVARGHEHVLDPRAYAAVVAEERDRSILEDVRNPNLNAVGAVHRRHPNLDFAV